MTNTVITTKEMRYEINAMKTALKDNPDGVDASWGHIYDTIQTRISYKEHNAGKEFVYTEDFILEYLDMVDDGEVEFEIMFIAYLSAIAEEERIENENKHDNENDD